MEVNKVMKEARKRIGLTQEKMAKEIGVCLRSYKMYEQAQRLPPVNVAVRIARTLNVSVESLFGDDRIEKGTE